ncbi:hypothetical protein [Pseudaestuariivita rosea]|uniref:hypothetical protein n=1 Tax=Pseudaestuariivita rosea TaxID=2763263 RepID=UPI001ABB8661|nr:hypothetical protein [Pseudaestuariivita rosea]
MEIYSKRWIAWLCIVIGSGILIFAFFALSTGFMNFGMFFGSAAALLVGILSLNKPLVRYGNKQLEFYNLYGMRMRSWSIDDLTVEDQGKDKTIVLVRKKNGKMKRVLSSTNINYNRDQARDLINAIRAEKAFA